MGSNIKPDKPKTDHAMGNIFRSKIISMMLVLGLCQTSVCAQSDGAILTYQAYLNNIFQYHPIAKQADLKIIQAEAEMLEAKGLLDPQVLSNWNQKNFDDLLYYRQYRSQVILPTRMGIDVVGGYENTQGVFLNPENKTDDLGLWHVGLEVNVLQGLWVNERRTLIQQAKVFQDLAKNERQLILNDLIYEASAAYLFWQQYAFFEQVFMENVSIANTYFENTKQSFFNGEKTAMDTLEAFILYQDAIVLLQKNELSLIKSRLHVENFLWGNGGPAALLEITQPEDYQNQILPVVNVYEETTLLSHPMLLASINKLSRLEIEQKLKREKLKPKLKLKLNPLLATSANSLAPNFSMNNYKWGFQFSMPLFMRKERAAIQKGKVKIQETQLDLQNKRNQLQNKIQNSWQQQIRLQAQLNLLSANVDSYKRLLDGENEKFNFGESSVFLLNKRQEKYINGQLKLIETYIRRQLEWLNFLYFSNQLIPG